MKKITLVLFLILILCNCKEDSYGPAKVSAKKQGASLNYQYAGAFFCLAPSNSIGLSIKQDAEDFQVLDIVFKESKCQGQAYFGNFPMLKDDVPQLGKDTVTVFLKDTVVTDDDGNVYYHRLYRNLKNIRSTYVHIWLRSCSQSERLLVSEMALSMRGLDKCLK